MSPSSSDVIDLRSDTVTRPSEAMRPPCPRRAVRYRRMVGGAMRQVGILAAAGLYALDRHLTQTDIVVFQLTPDAPRCGHRRHPCTRTGCAAVLTLLLLFSAVTMTATTALFKRTL